MNTRKNLVIAAAVTAVLGSAAVVGTSVADHRGHGWRSNSDAGHGPKMQGIHHRRHGHQHGAWRRIQKMLEDYDSDENGALSQDEIDQARQERLAKFDADQDGRLNLQEYQALWLDRMRSRMVDRFQHLDEDGDAAITVEEFVAPTDNLVMRMDRNEDGQLSRDDLPRRQRGRHRQAQGSEPSDQ